MVTDQPFEVEGSLTTEREGPAEVLLHHLRRQDLAPSGGTCDTCLDHDHPTKEVAGFCLGVAAVHPDANGHQNAPPVLRGALNRHGTCCSRTRRREGQHEPVTLALRDASTNQGCLL